MIINMAFDVACRSPQSSYNIFILIPNKRFSHQKVYYPNRINPKKELKSTYGFTKPSLEPKNFCAFLKKFTSFFHILKNKYYMYIFLRNYLISRGTHMIQYDKILEGGKQYE